MVGIDIEILFRRTSLVFHKLIPFQSHPELTMHWWGCCLQQRVQRCLLETTYLHRHLLKAQSPLPLPLPWRQLSRRSRWKVERLVPQSTRGPTCQRVQSTSGWDVCSNPVLMVPTRWAKNSWIGGNVLGLIGISYTFSLRSAISVRTGWD